MGKDLENNANVKSLKKFIDSGNEVGSHSFSHFQNFGTLKYKEIKEEIKKTDEIIFEKLNKKPIGFIAPELEILQIKF